MNNFWLEKASEKNKVQEPVFPTIADVNCGETFVIQQFEIAQPKNEISFFIHDKEMLRISPEGFYVEGKFIHEGKDVYDGFVNFLKLTNNI